MLKDHSPRRLPEGELEAIDARSALAFTRGTTHYRLESAQDVPKLLAHIASLELTIELAEKRLAAGDASDGFHTHKELYEARLLLHAHATPAWLAQGWEVVKSRRHHDGELCFDGEYFIVVAQLPTGQVSFHYRLADWDLFAVPEVPLPPEWDGHSPAEAARRLHDALAASSGPEGA